MNNQQVKLFFNCSKTCHKDLLLNNSPVWQILNELNIYIKDWFLNGDKAKTNEHIFKGVWLENQLTFIDKGTVIEPGAYIKGPAIIGKNCLIRHNAYIRENVIVGDNCIIGNATEIKNSLILNNVSLAHFNYVGDSILGNNVSLGAGVKLANFRLDKKNIYITFQNKKINTAMQKFGSILGDNVSIGCNSVCNPGTILEKNCIVYPLTLVNGYHKENSLIKK